MNTKILMTTCAITLVGVGIILNFLPEEVLNVYGLTTTKSLQVLIQIVGALYFAFGMLNWMTKDSLIGGIYNRPVVVANLSHFVIGSLGLIKGLMSNPNQPYVVWIAATIYLIFALSFGIILFQHPSNEETQ